VLQKGHEVTIFFLLWCVAIGLLGCATSPARITEQSGEVEFAKFLESIRIDQGLPALAGAVIIDGKIHATAAVGTREARTDRWVNVDDRFLIGSCGKAFTATLAAKSVEEGRLSWQTTVRDVFPDLEMLPAYENITLQQLLSHRAGLPLINTNIEFDKNRGTTPEIIRRQYLEQTVQQKLINPTDKVLSLSNSGYMLAAVMLETIMGQAYEELLAKKISRPLNLSSVGTGAPAESQPASQPLGHIKSDSTIRVIRKDFPNYWAPAGMIHLSIKDWARFILVHLGADRGAHQNLLKPGTLGILHSPPNTATWAANFPLKDTFARSGLSPTSSNYALGWFTQETKKGDNLLWHLGVTKSFIALGVLAPRTKNAILLVTNALVSHRFLIRANKEIKGYYAAEADLPVIE
jgi:CubicO group peptidase (beta-lactamase class C family)